MEAGSPLLFREQGPGLPQFREEFLVQSEFQVRGARASACTDARANDALHQLNMSQSPADDQLIKLRQPFTDVNPIPVLLLVPVQREHRACARIELFTFGCILVDLKLSHRAQSRKEYVVQRRLAQPPL